MKYIRSLAIRGVLVPFALFALVLASSLPASAQTLTATDSSTAFDIGATPDSMNW